MNLRNFERLDPNLLPGLINTALRNDCANFDDLVKTHDLDRERLLETLDGIGYQYDPELNQVRPLQSRRNKTDG